MSHPSHKWCLVLRYQMKRRGTRGGGRIDWNKKDLQRYHIGIWPLGFSRLPLPQMLSAITVLRSWSLCSKWKNPSRICGWGEVGQLYWGKGVTCSARWEKGRKWRAGISWYVIFISPWTWRWGGIMSSPGSTLLWASGRNPWTKRGSHPRLFYPYSN
jgi:hypothetical protein